MHANNLNGDCEYAKSSSSLYNLCVHSVAENLPSVPVPGLLEVYDRTTHIYHLYFLSVYLQW